MRKALPVLVGMIVVGAGLVGLRLVFTGRDDAGVSSDAAPAGPGGVETEPGDPPTSGEAGPDNVTREGRVEDPVLVRALASGNVALVHGTAQPPPELEQLRDDAAGPFDPELAAAGLAVFLVRRPGVEGVQALAWQRRLEVDSPADPRLREFIDAFLGQGEGG